MLLSPLEQIAAARGLTLEELAQGGEDEPPQAARPGSEITRGPEFLRVRALPRRPTPATDPAGAALAAEATRALARSATPYPGPLRPIQAAALHELWQYGGIFGPIRAGYGKTLLAYLAPTVARAARPLYVSPKGLQEDARREFRKFAQHWHGPHPDHYPMASYETLSSNASGVRLDTGGNIVRPALLDRLAPDLIVFDEVHKLKNPKAAVTRRVRRYLQANPQVRVIVMSGTMTRKSLKDFAHLAKWSIGKMTPVPTTHLELETWADALDEKTSARGPRAGVGALSDFCTDDEKRAFAASEDTARVAARKAVRRRIVETPGVVATQDGPLGIPIEIHAIFPEREDPRVDEFFESVRELGELPDGQPIVDGLEMARHCYTMGLGLWLRWNPRPPDEWVAARREWGAYCRDVLKYNRKLALDSESPVKSAVRSGLLNDHGALAEWEEIEPTFTPSTEAVWFSDEVVQTARKWVAEHPAGIIWTQHIDVGVRLSEELGIDYYGAEGRNSNGRFILDHPKHTPIVASADANRTGRNLQWGWSDNLLLCPPDEQLLARTHRDGQAAEHGARFWCYFGCIEHARSYANAYAAAYYADDMFGQAMRLVYAESDVPAPEELEEAGPRWTK